MTISRRTAATLVVNGSNDVIMPTVNSFIMQAEHPVRALVIYPDSNHGPSFNIPSVVSSHAVPEG